MRRGESSPPFPLSHLPTRPSPGVGDPRRAAAAESEPGGWQTSPLSRREAGGRWERGKGGEAAKPYPMYVRNPLRLLAATILIVFCGCARDRASGPLPQDAYVWQRAWTPAVRDAAGKASDFQVLVILAAEVDLSTRPPRIARPGIAWDDLKGRPVGLALRIGRFQGWGGGTGRFADDPETVRLLADLAGELTAQARSRGLDLREIQLDYDCPESKIADYPVLVEAVERQVGSVPVTITALPSWLRHERAFRKLAQAADGFVLQVHSLQVPQQRGRPFALVDPEAARRAVEDAGGAGRLFRVALPTYAYAVVRDKKGDLLGVVAEGGIGSGGTGLPEVASDPEAMAGLVREWTRDRPRELAGLIWYRLPVEGDTRNWSPATLRAVMAGRAPRSELRTEIQSLRPGLAEILLVNRGEAALSWPSPLHIRWDSDNLIAADGIAGYRLLRTGPREARLEKPPDAARALQPGERRIVAWLRFLGSTEVHVEIPSSPTG